MSTAMTPARAATVSEIMTPSPYCVRPDLTVSSLTRLLLDQDVSGVPVVDQDGRARGVVSKTDVLRSLDAGIADATVADIMTPVVLALRHDVEIVRAAALMAGDGIHRLAILDEAGAVIGILSALDIVRWVAGQHGYPV